MTETAPTVLLDPAEAMVGLLMHAAAPAEVLRILSTVGPSDFADPELEAIIRLIRGLAQAGEKSDPRLVLAAARRELDIYKSHRIGVRIFDLYSAAPPVSTSSSFGRALREEAARRAAVALGERLQQAATASLESLRQVLEDVAAEAEQHARRLVGVQHEATR